MHFRAKFWSLEVQQLFWKVCCLANGDSLMPLWPQGFQQCLRTCVAIITWRIVLASSGERPRTLLKILPWKTASWLLLTTSSLKCHVFIKHPGPRKYCHFNIKEGQRKYLLSPGFWVTNRELYIKREQGTWEIRQPEFYPQEPDSSAI